MKGVFFMNPRYNNFNNMPKNDRFVFPFLTGALVGGAAVGLTRPRPIYNVAPYPPGPPLPPPRPPYGMPYYSTSYNYNSFGPY